jgi:hypothetical protein
MELSMNNHVDQVAGVKEETLIGFEANAVAFYAQISGLATDKIGYPIREICTNAWDAARGRFEVFLPTQLRPLFRVRDYGPGMSHEDMMGRFARMYASDKRGKNESVGGWGLGRFSGFAYLISANGSGAFTVVSRFDGVARAYVVSLSESGQPMIRLMSEKPTTEESGLDVSFAVEKRDVWQFAQRAKEILWSFEPRPTVTPAIDFTEPKVIARGDGWTFYDENTVPFSNPCVRMGCVSYEIDLDQFDESFFFGQGDAVLFDVPIGSLRPTLSREGLAYDAMTKATISSAMRRVKDEVVGQIRTAVRSTSSLLAACGIFYKATEGYGHGRRAMLRSAFDWNELGHSIPRVIASDVAKMMHLPTGWADVSTFKGEVIKAEDVSSDTLVILQHAYANSGPKLEQLGVTGRQAIWVRCRKADREQALRDLGNPQVLELDAIKVVTEKREKTTFRKRRVYRRGYKMEGYVKPVDMAAGGFYVGTASRGASINIEPGVYRYVDKRDLAIVVEQAENLGVIDRGIELLVRYDGETLGENWVPFGPHLIEALKGIVDTTQSDRSSLQGVSSMPSDLRSFVTTRRKWGTKTPQCFLDLAQDISAELAALEVSRPTTNSDTAISALKRIGVTVPLPPAEQRSFNALRARYNDIMRTYPLYSVLVEKSYPLATAEQYDHYFDICEKANVGLVRAADRAVDNDVDGDDVDLEHELDDQLAA